MKNYKKPNVFFLIGVVLLFGVVFRYYSYDPHGNMGLNSIGYDGTFFGYILWSPLDLLTIFIGLSLFGVGIMKFFKQAS